MPSFSQMKRLELERCYMSLLLEVSNKNVLLLRWNMAASANGYAGSEFSDEPELVFDLVRAQRASLYSLLRKAKEPHV